ncbi:peptidylprolyl isomerase [bacterium]|nr:peptidylprolyl isomerase [bacterium]
MNNIRGAIVLAALGALVAGCSGGGGVDEKVVAKAGDITITLADFQEAYTRISADSRPDISTLEGKRGFANDLVNQRILLEEGARITGEHAELIRDQIDQTRRQNMLSALYRTEVEEKVEVLAADVKELYDRRSENIKASHILVETEAEAQRIREEITSGKISFEDAARKYSMDQSTKRGGGSLGEIRWSTTVPAFQAVAFDMENVGDISQPVSTNFGVHLIRLDARIPQEQEPFEALRVTLRPDVRRMREVLRMDEFIAGLEKNAGLQMHDDAFEVLLDAMGNFASQDIDTIPAERRYIPDVTPEQAQMPLATWNGGEWKIADHLDWLRARPVTGRPLTRIPMVGMKEIVRTAQIRNQLLVEEAEAQGYAERPDVAIPTQRRGEALTIEIVHGRFLQQADVPAEDAKAFYDSTIAANDDAFVIPDRIDPVVIIQSDEAKVREALKQLRAGVDEQKVIQQFSIDPKSKANGGRMGLVPRGTFDPKLEDSLFDPSLVGKGWQGPMFASNGVAAVKMLDYQKTRRATFEEMEGEITRQLANARGEMAFEQWLLEQRDARGVEIFDEALELYGQPIS